MRNAFWGPDVLVDDSSVAHVRFVRVDTEFAGEPAEGPPDPADVHKRTLGPGQYYFEGYLGLWQDRPHVLNETTLLEPAPVR